MIKYQVFDNEDALNEFIRGLFSPIRIISIETVIDRYGIHAGNKRIKLWYEQ